MYQSQHEPGLRALLLLAEAERDVALQGLRRHSGDELVASQSRYNAMQDIIDFVTKQPVRIAGGEN